MTSQQFAKHHQAHAAYAASVSRVYLIRCFDQSALAIYYQRESARIYAMARQRMRIE